MPGILAIHQHCIAGSFDCQPHHQTVQSYQFDSEPQTTLPYKDVFSEPNFKRDCSDRVLPSYDNSEYLGQSF